MKRVVYSKYVPDPAGEMSMEELLNALSDYLLQSGFQNSWGMYEMRDGEETLEELKRAIEEALMNSDVLDEQLRAHMEQMIDGGSFERMVDQLIERMEQEGVVSAANHVGRREVLAPRGPER